MGGGNAQKTAIARQKAQEKARKAGGGGQSQLKNNAAANNIVCNICRATFLCTSTPAKLAEHVESKHSKQGFAACFPDRPAP